MKKIFLFLLTSVFILASCNDEWNKHYDEGGDGETVSPLTLKEYFDSENSYSEFYTLLKDAGVADELGKNQFLTIWAVKNDNYDDSDYETLNDTLLGGYHLCNLSFGTTELKDGLRIMSLNGIYVTISQNSGDFYVNKSQILSSKRFKNGVVHEISSLMRPLTNMFEYIRTLDDSYSIMRDSILYYNEKVFDIKNSTPVGVDPSGNTVYDSVFTIDNPIFKKANLASEFDQFTMFLPDNDMVLGAIDAMREKYTLLGKVYSQADTVMAINWMKNAIFHDGVISDYNATLDLTSPLGGVWRTSVQNVDQVDFDDLSNGRVYKVTKMKVPNNTFITRVKSLAHFYEFLTDEEKAQYFSSTSYIDTHDSGGGPVGAPFTRYWTLKATGDKNTNDELYLEISPFSYNYGTGETAHIKVPTGEYNLYMGFHSSKHPFVDIYFNSGSDPIPSTVAPVRTDIDITKATPWNFDRNNGQDKNRYDGLGGLVGVVNVEGDNDMESFRIKVRYVKLGASDGSKELRVYHWSLTPTSNNY